MLGIGHGPELKLKLLVRLPRLASLWLLGALLSALVMVSAALLLVNQRSSELLHTERELKNISLVLSEQTDRAFQALEIVQSAVIDHMRGMGISTEQDYLQRMSGYDTHVLLKQQIAGLPHVDAVTLISREGRLINFSRYWPIPKVIVSDRDYFKALSSDPQLQSFVSEPVPNRGTGTWTIYIARKLSAPDGAFLGLVLGAMKLSYFEDFYRNISLGANSSIGMFRQDGVLLARYPHIDPKIGHRYGETENFRRVLENINQGTVRQTSLIDGKDRMMAAYKVSHFPVVHVVTEDMDVVLSRWRREAAFVAGGALFTVLVIFSLVFLGARQIRAQEALEQARAAQREAEFARNLAESDLQLARERAEGARALQAQCMRFDAALSNMLQGLAMFDREGRLLVCNRRCHQLLGGAGSEAAPGSSFDALLGSGSSCGQLTHEDVQILTAWVAQVAAARLPETFIWQIASGPVFSVSYQPMDDAGWLVTFEDITQRRQAEERVTYLAHHDPLTGLPNRILLDKRLKEMSARIVLGQQSAVLCLDLDRFKRVNDSLGHPIGDALLKSAAQRLLACVREVDTVTRLGGDEFAILLSGIRQPLDATSLAGWLIEVLSQPFQVDGHQVVIGASVGIAFGPQDGIDGQQLLRNADLALYGAKVDGGGVVRLFHAKMDAEMQARRALELDLRAALRDGQFNLFFQPFVDIATRAVTGYEALLRWQHPRRGLVMPTEFVAMAEEIGLIVPIAEWVLQHACHTAIRWPAHLKVSVNISPIQFRGQGLVAAVEFALRASGLAPERLELEITETVLLNETASTLTTLHAIRELGVAIVMDDFGTGYSSLSYLRQFPFNKIKIDQSFVRDLQTRKDCAAIIRAVTSLGTDLGMSTTAEGVETLQQFEVLAQAGCTAVQGFMFGLPCPAELIQFELAPLAPKATGQMLASAAE